MMRPGSALDAALSFIESDTRAQSWYAHIGCDVIDCWLLDCGLKMYRQGDLGSSVDEKTCNVHLGQILESFQAIEDVYPHLQ